ncbi:MAG TPA: Gfo/Idh/MocA family oxidoreductase [Candidatus Hydrogenedentes bacterium]|nr:Gfo/Idh/MocA family oxidoreductase [Candidatus Hydrogenedentota bacterium]
MTTPGKRKPVTRRRFLASVAGAGLFAILPARGHAVQAARRVGPNDRVRVVVIGNGGMGTRHTEALCANPQCELVGLCDVAKGRGMPLLEKVRTWLGQPVPVYQDFREVLDRPDVDAVFVVTPDHWHPLLTIMACEAGKDVYVEKPVCTTIEEGRAMVEAARRYGRVVQVGTQQRSMPVFQKAISLVRGGRIGQVTHATAWVGVNGWQVRQENYTDPPKGLDWDMWLGPAPWVPFSMERYMDWMGWHDYARGGQLTNWGVHLVDVVQWGIGHDRPLAVQALGGSYRGHAGQDNYETIEAILEYPGVTVTWEQRHSNTHGGKGYGIAFYGTDGALFVDRGSFVVETADGRREWVGEPEKSWAYPPHHNNFFECVRSRLRPVADIEQGFRSTSAVLLAGIALKTGGKLLWDGDREQFIGNGQADRLLRRAYRAPWHL